MPVPPYPLQRVDVDGVLSLCDGGLMVSSSKSPLDLLDLYWASSSSLMYLELRCCDTLPQVLIPICLFPSHAIFQQRCFPAWMYKLV